MFWILLWVAIAVFIMGFYVWSLHILFLQKKAWSAFSKKSGLNYDAPRLTESPSLSGKLGGYMVKVYTDTKVTEDVRGQRQVTAIDVQLGAGMPLAAAIGTANTKDFMENLILEQKFTPEHPKWKEEYEIRTNDFPALKDYLTAERLDVLTSLLGMKNTLVLYIFDDLESVLRIETADPFIDAKQLEKFLRKIISASKKLTVEDGVT